VNIIKRKNKCKKPRLSGPNMFGIQSRDFVPMIAGIVMLGRFMKDLGGILK